MMMLLAVAAHSQYRFGENTSAWISSPAVRLYRCLDSFRSHSIVVPSLPPDAHSEPSGEIVTVLMYPVWPMWSVWMRHVLRVQTCFALVSRVRSKPSLEAAAFEGDQCVVNGSLMAV